MNVTEGGVVGEEQGGGEGVKKGEGKDEQQPSPSDDYGTQALPVTVSEKSECGC